MGQSNNNMSMGMCLGIAIGFCIGMSLDEAEKKKREDAKKNAEMRQRLLEIKAKRQDAALENMSDEDLDKALAELSE